MQGKIIRWIDDKGYGFIRCDEHKGDIFVHISKFKNGYRRPKVDDKVDFQIELSGEKASAKAVSLVGVEPTKPTNNPFLLVIQSLLLAAIGAAVYLWVIEPKLNPQYENMGFSCQGKTYCSQMTSCDEAKFYLSNCPNVKIDGDRDGVPCERQLCNN